MGKNKTTDMERRAVAKALAIGIPTSAILAGGAALFGAGSRAGGNLALDDLTDVTVPSPANDDVLTFESATSLWKNKPAGAGSDIKVKTSSADTTSGFLDEELTVDSGYLSKAVQNPAANENLLLSVVNPITKQIQLVPSTDITPFIAKGFPGGTSNIGEIFDSTNPTQIKKWFFDKDGDLIMRRFSGNLTPRIKTHNDNPAQGVFSLLWEDSAGKMRLGEASTDIGTLIFQIDGEWRVNGDTRGSTFSDFSTGDVLLKRLVQTFEGTTYTGAKVSTASRSIIIGGDVAIVNSTLVPFVALIIEQLGADPVNLNQGRIWARTDLSPRRLKYSLDGTTVKTLAYTDDSLRESLVAVWDRNKTWVNIGTAFVDWYVLVGEAGFSQYVDFTNKTQYAAQIWWNKIGAGTQTCQLVDADNAANVLTLMDVVTGQNVLALTALPAWATGVKRVKPQAKSTTGADDPVAIKMTLRLK